MTAKPTVVFFSWQKTRAPREHWSIIEDALERAAETVGAELGEAVVVTRDTVDLPGAPNIFEAIRSKIDICALAVFDVSFVGNLANGASTPNPNVLVELGYALARLPPSRIMLVFNLEHGELRDLPFDLAQARVATYRLGEGEKPAASRKALVESLKSNIRAILRPPAVELREIQVGPITRVLEEFVPDTNAFWLHVEPGDPNSLHAESIELLVLGRIGRGTQWGEASPLYRTTLNAGAFGFETLSTEISAGRSGEVSVRARTNGFGTTIRYGRR